MANLDWDVGDTIHLACEFSLSGTATDPTTVTLIVQDPSGNQTTYTYAGATVTKDSTGNYSKNVELDEAGTWSARWVGTGTVAAADETEWKVTRSVMS